MPKLPPTEIYATKSRRRSGEKTNIIYLRGFPNGLRKEGHRRERSTHERTNARSATHAPRSTPTPRLLAHALAGALCGAAPLRCSSCVCHQQRLPAEWRMHTPWPLRLRASVDWAIVFYPRCPARGRPRRRLFSPCQHVVVVRLCASKREWLVGCHRLSLLRQLRPRQLDRKFAARARYGCYGSRPVYGLVRHPAALLAQPQARARCGWDAARISHWLRRQYDASLRPMRKRRDAAPSSPSRVAIF